MAGGGGGRGGSWEEMRLSRPPEGWQKGGTKRGLSVAERSAVIAAVEEVDHA